MKRTVRNVLVSIAALLLIAGCASTGRPFAPTAVEPGKAVVYFYRPSAFTLSGRTIFMAFPGSNLSYAMVNGGYYPLVLDPGTYEIGGVGTDAKPVYFSISVKEGDERYVRVAFAETMALTVPASFREVPASQGSQEIRACALISPKR